MTAGAMLAVVGVYTFFAVPPLTNDFGVFYREGAAWLDGRPLYAGAGRPNLNPPAPTVALFGPLARLPYEWAQIVWLIAGALSVAASIRLVRHELRLSPRQVVEVAGLLFMTQGALMALRSGQVTWLLLYPVTRAWAAHRRGRDTHTGIWLGLAIAVKPPLALIALLLPLTTILGGGVTALLLSAAMLPVTGWEPWVTWVGQRDAVTWLASPANASLWGAAARLEWRAGAAPGLADLSLLSFAGVLLAGAALGFDGARQRQPDRRFFCAVLWSLLVSPLGWAYYLPLAVGPAAAAWPATWGATIAYGLTLMPVAFGILHVDRLPVSVFVVAVLAAWFSWASPRPPATGRLPGDR